MKHALAVTAETKASLTTLIKNYSKILTLQQFEKF